MLDKVNNEENELNLLDLIKLLWKEKNTIFFTTLCGAIFSVFYALSLSDIYTSQALLAPVGVENQSNASATNAISALGLNIQQQTYTKDQEAIEIIKSYNFFVEKFLSNIKYENLMASKNWNKSSNKIIYTDNFDSSTKKWKIDENGNELKPSTQMAYKKYLNILDIKKNQLNPFITISISHHSPHIAKSWIEIIIDNINLKMREIDNEKARNSIIFLKKNLVEANIEEVKETSSFLIEEQTKFLMLSEVNTEYVFKYLNSPLAPDLKSAPSRAYVCIVITISVFLLSVIFVFFKDFLRKDKSIQNA